MHSVCYFLIHILLNFLEPGCYGITFEPSPECTTLCWHLHRENPTTNHVDAPRHVSMPIACLKSEVDSGQCKFACVKK